MWCRVISVSWADGESRRSTPSWSSNSSRWPQTQPKSGWVRIACMKSGTSTAISYKLWSASCEMRCFRFCCSPLACHFEAVTQTCVSGGIFVITSPTCRLLKLKFLSNYLPVSVEQLGTITYTHVPCSVVWTEELVCMSWEHSVETELSRSHCLKHFIGNFVQHASFNRQFSLMSSLTRVPAMSWPA